MISGEKHRDEVARSEKIDVGGKKGGERERGKKNYVNSVTYYNIDKHKQLNGKFNVTLSASR